MSLSRIRFRSHTLPSCQPSSVPRYPLPPPPYLTAAVIYGTNVKPFDIAKQGLEEAKKKKIDVVIVDTAGRLQIDKSMMDELKEVKQALNPTGVLLAVDAMQDKKQHGEKQRLCSCSYLKEHEVVLQDLSNKSYSSL